MKKSSLTLLAGLLLIGISTSVQASVLVNADFDAGYTPGDLDGQSGTDDVGLTDTFSGSNNASAMLSVVTGGLTYNNGSVDIPGGSQSVMYTSTTGSVVTATDRSLSSTITGTDIYERIVFSGAVGGPGSYADFTVGVTSLAQNGNTNFNRLDGVGLQGTTDNAGNSTFGANISYFYTNNFADSGTASTTPGTHLLIAQFVYTPNGGDPKYSTVNFFLDPSSLTIGTPIATATSDAYGGFDTFGIGVANGSSGVQIDSLAIGTTYADVVTGVPEPATWAMLVVSTLAAAVCMIRRRLS